MLNDALISLARPGFRQGRQFFVLTLDALETWAREQRLTLHQAYAEALAAGIFPESLERNFPALTAADQNLLFHSRVLVVGLGGLGGYQAELLARLGVGRLLLADGDQFTPANLNRQLLATGSSLGHAKAAATAEHLRNLNPALEIQPLNAYLDAAAYDRFLPRVDLALDALDSLAARRELLAAARRAGKPFIHGAVLGADGQVATILPDDEPIFGARHLSQTNGDTEPPPVLSPIVAVVAGLQVQEAVRLLLARPLAYHGRLAYLDGDTGRLEFFPFA